MNEESRSSGGQVQTLAGETAPFTSQTVIMGNDTLTAKMQDIFKKQPELLK